jgi:hypothetical protein
VASDGGRLLVRGPRGHEDLARRLIACKADIFPLIEQERSSAWDESQAQAGACRWSARLREQLRPPWLTAAQRRILERRLVIIQDWLNSRDAILLDDANMRLWVEGTLARWEEDRQASPSQRGDGGARHTGGWRL